MDERRVARYIDKLRHMEERIGDILSWINEAEVDKKSRLAVYKAAQEAIEAACDVVAMFLKDNGYPPKDDYTNIQKWGELVDSRIAECLKIANGLRNRLVHHYNGINDRLALESIMDLIPCLEDFIKVSKSWLKKKL
ncbi:MAG: DUF86 domain-containing protein [Archaeoglobales archaeon]|nr:MAG: DUF86 domain-containing protein [Archaeoglobales archaeon]